jgi:dTDP-4-amino-4,6-dideoxygalactose transaminase
MREFDAWNTLGRRIAERYLTELAALSRPVWPHMTEAMVDRVIAAVSDFFASS